MGFFFFFQAEDGIRDVAVTGVQTCALPISATFCSYPRGRFPMARKGTRGRACDRMPALSVALDGAARDLALEETDRKSTRLNSSHGYISYAVFCLKKKKK